VVTVFGSVSTLSVYSRITSTTRGSQYCIPLCDFIFYCCEALETFVWINLLMTGHCLYDATRLETLSYDHFTSRRVTVRYKRQTILQLDNPSKIAV